MVSERELAELREKVLAQLVGGRGLPEIRERVIRVFEQFPTHQTPAVGSVGPNRPEWEAYGTYPDGSPII
jgi:hypothetical protein